MRCAKSCSRSSRRCAAREASSRSTVRAKSSWNSIRKVCFAPAERRVKSRGSRSIGLKAAQSAHPRDCLLDGARSSAFFEPAGSQRVIFGLHYHHTISALFLGAVQGFVGKLDQSLVRACAARQDECCADAQRQPARHPRRLMANIEFLYGALNSRQHFGNVFAAGFVQDDRELFSAITRHEIQGSPCTLTEAHGDGPQAFVARLMSVAIVVVLEKIIIGEQHRHAFPIAHGLLPDPLDVLVEHPPVLYARPTIPRP